MKYTYLYMLLGTWLLAACSDDKGNYDYSEINEVTVTDVEEGKWYTKMAFVDNLTFNPKVQPSLGSKEDSDYEYEWKLIPSGTDFKDIDDLEGLILSRERRIDCPLTMKPGDYAGFFMVKDRQTGVTWTTRFYVRLRSMTSEGWMVLCEQDGKSRMDIVFNLDEKQDAVAHDIWREADFRPGKPKRLIFNYDLGEQASLLVTDETTYNLDVDDLHAGEDNELKWRFGITPENIRVAASGMSQFAANNCWAIVDEQGDVYTLSRSVNGGVFEYPVNKLNGDDEFHAAPFVGVSYDNDYNGIAQGCAPIMLYDATNQQFLVIRNGASYPSVMTFEGTPFFEAQTGLDMVHMESTKPGLIYTILKSRFGQFYFYGMKLCGETTYDPDDWWEEYPIIREYNQRKYYGEVSGEALSEARLFACHHMFPYLFYVSGESVYQFDMGHPDRPARKVITLPGEEIKVLKFTPFVAWEAYQDWERARNYQLLVGSNVVGGDESECGVMRFYDVPDLMGDLTKVKETTGLGKIVDIAYKERKRNN